MLMDLAVLVDRWSIPVAGGVLHLGAHLAEEAPAYAALDAEVVWVEANPAVLHKIEQVLRRFPKQRLVHALVADVGGEIRPFHVTNYDGMSSSLLAFGSHPEFSPDTVFVDELNLTTSTVDAIVDEFDVRASFLVMDLQGAEGMALAGATRLLPHLDAVMSEVNDRDVYQGCAKVWELDEMLGEHGLERVETSMVPGQGWGDALWVRNR